MSKAKIKVKPLQLKAREEKDLEETLESSKKSGKFDETILTKLKQQLVVYSEDLSKAYDLVSSDTNKLTLKNAYTSTTVLLK